LVRYQAAVQAVTELKLQTAPELQRRFMYAFGIGPATAYGCAHIAIDWLAEHLGEAE